MLYFARGDCIIDNFGGGYRVIRDFRARHRIIPKFGIGDRGIYDFAFGNRIACEFGVSDRASIDFAFGDRGISDFRCIDCKRRDVFRFDIRIDFGSRIAFL